jgi:hypothetical protein
MCMKIAESGNLCDICGKPLESRVDKRYGKGYHWECAYNAPDMVEARKLAQSAVPHKVKKNENPK